MAVWAKGCFRPQVSLCIRLLVREAIFLWGYSNLTPIGKHSFHFLWQYFMDYVKKPSKYTLLNNSIEALLFSSIE